MNHTKRYVILLLILGAGFYLYNSSNGSSRGISQNGQLANAIENFLVTQAPEGETTLIENDVAVFTNPSEEQISNLESTLPEEDFFAAMDDWSWYRSQALLLLQEKNMNAMNEPPTRYIKFTHQNETYYLDTEANKQDLSNIIFFSEDKMPKVVQLIDIQQEYANYYEAR